MSNIKNQIYVKENAVTVGECDNLIKRFHKHEWFLSPGYVGDREEKQDVKKSTDLTLPWNIVRQHKDFLPFSTALHNGFTEYIKELEDIINHNPMVVLFNLFNMQWYKPGEGFYEYHSELNPGAHDASASRCAAWMFNLNTIENGGGTEFKYFDDKIEPKAGQLSIFPAYFTHTHRGIVAPEEDKYIITGWFHYQLEGY